MKIKSKAVLSLLVAGMLTVGATGVYASQTITGSDEAEYAAPVTVNGTVLNDDNLAPDGMLNVTMPTVATFGVDAEGTLVGTNMTITNDSRVGVNVEVTNFTETIVGGGINALATNAALTNRADVILNLQGNAGAVNLTTDAAFAGGLVSSIGPASEDIMSLGGVAGQQPDGTLDADGTNEEFNIIFKIAKQ